MSKNIYDIKKDYLAKTKNMPGSNMNENIVDINRTYLAIIKNSLDTKMFQNLYIFENKEKNKSVDIAEKGKLSCALFVSYILYVFDLINSTHATVEGTRIDMQQFGWKEIDKLKKRAVIIWEEKKYESGEMHPHIGFYIGNNEAISTNTKKGIVGKHHYSYGDKTKKTHRVIKAILWHDKLN